MKQLAANNNDFVEKQAAFNNNNINDINYNYTCIEIDEWENANDEVLNQVSLEIWNSAKSIKEFKQQLANLGIRSPKSVARVLNIIIDNEEKESRKTTTTRNSNENKENLIIDKWENTDDSLLLDVVMNVFNSTNNEKEFLQQLTMLGMSEKSQKRIARIMIHKLQQLPQQRQQQQSPPQFGNKRMEPISGMNLNEQLWNLWQIQ